MPLEHKTKKIIILIVILVVLLGAGIIFILWPTFTLPPSEEVLNPWKTSTDEVSGYSFSYPVRLPAEYIKALNWPPKLQEVNEAFNCAFENEGNMETVREQVENRQYCITKIVEGAAGSTYTQYAYAFPKDNKTFIFTFTVQAAQCANYDDLQKIACEEERYFFSLDGIVDRMAQSVSVSQ